LTGFWSVAAESLMTTLPRSVSDLVERLQGEIPLWGYLPAAMRFKQALVAAVGVDAAFQICRAHPDVPELEVLQLRPVRSLYHAAKQAAVAFHERWSGGARFVLQPPRV